MLFRKRAVSAFLMCWFGVGCLLTGSANAQSWPDEHRNPPFYYHADFQLAPYHGLLQSVTDLQHEVPATLGLQPLDERVHLFLFQRQRTYQLYLKKYFPSVPDRPALFVKQRGPGMVFARVSSHFAVDLRHETTHAVLHGVLPMVPLWLDEGLGEYFEVAASEREFGNPHLNGVKTAVQRGNVPRLDRLESLASIEQMRAEHYRDAWAWVHFMLHGSAESREVLISFLQDIENSSPPGKLSVRFRRTIPKLELAFERHFRQMR